MVERMQGVVCEIYAPISLITDANFTQYIYLSAF
jgi:hypothetical protein